MHIGKRKHLTKEYEEITIILHLCAGHDYRSRSGAQRERPGTDAGNTAYRTETIRQRTDKAIGSTQRPHKETDTTADGHHEACRPERTDALLTATGQRVRSDLRLPRGHKAISRLPPPAVAVYQFPGKDRERDSQI